MLILDKIVIFNVFVSNFKGKNMVLFIILSQKEIKCKNEIQKYGKKVDYFLRSCFVACAECDGMVWRRQTIIPLAR